MKEQHDAAKKRICLAATQYNLTKNIDANIKQSQHESPFRKQDLTNMRKAIAETLEDERATRHAMFHNDPPKTWATSITTPTIGVHPSSLPPISEDRPPLVLTPACMGGPMGTDDSVDNSKRSGMVLQPAEKKPHEEGLVLTPAPRVRFAPSTCISILLAVVVWRH